MPSRKDKDVMSHLHHSDSKIEQAAPSSKKSTAGTMPKSSEQRYTLIDDGEDENVVLGYN